MEIHKKKYVLQKELPQPTLIIIIIITRFIKTCVNSGHFVNNYQSN